VYADKAEIPRVLGGLGIAILSTSRGVLTDRQAKKLGVGGEVLAYVW
jgi:small subunit ribosomal protein S8